MSLMTPYHISPHLIAVASYSCKLNEGLSNDIKQVIKRMDERVGKLVVRE